ncbi:MAG: hypothetical protein RI945_113 [Candidatus Parcubacteria bacterium]
MNLDLLQNSVSMENFPDGQKKLYLSPRATTQFLKKLLEEMRGQQKESDRWIGRLAEDEILTLLDRPIVRNQIIVKVEDRIIVGEEALCDFLQRELEKYFPA